MEYISFFLTFVVIAKRFQVSLVFLTAQSHICPELTNKKIQADQLPTSKA